MSQMQFFLIFLSMTVAICPLLSQNLNLDVEGNSRLTGHLDLTADIDDSTSIHIGRGAGINQSFNGPKFNTFVGSGAGMSTDIASNNSFFGAAAGQKNIASGNSFFGMNAGFNNLDGTENAFFGVDAGFFNTSGRDNAFFGAFAGDENTTGSSNSYFGYDAGSSNQTGIENAAFGKDAGRGNKASGNSFFGYRAGFKNDLATGNAMFGYRAGENNVGNDNAFFGYDAGTNNDSGFENSFFGANAGHANISGKNNAIFGTDAGKSNQSGNFNSFFGSSAGFSVEGEHNTFVGYQSGFSTSSGTDNTFVGSGAGFSNSAGSLNAFVGKDAGRMSTGEQNTFVGAGAAFMNSSGGGNTFVGAGGGESNTTGIGNTTVGFLADVGAVDLINASAIGANAEVNLSNSLVLGSIAGTNGASNSTNVGIGTTAPTERLHVAFPNAQVLIGDPGCASQSYGGIGFDSSLDCNNFALLGRGDITIVNRPTGGAIAFRENNSNQMVLQSGGVLQLLNLGAAGSTNLCINGSDEISNCSSSIRYKDELSVFRSGHFIVEHLQPVTFRWKDSGERDLGLIAEEVAEIEPLLVTYNDQGGVEGVKYDRLGVVLIQVVKEQQKMIDSYKAKIANLVNQQAEQDKLISGMEQRLVQLESKVLVSQEIEN